MPYIDYLTAVLEMYAVLCLDRNVKARDVLGAKIPGPGLTQTYINQVLQKEKLHKKLKGAFIFLAQVMCIDMEYYQSLLGV